MMMAIYYRLLNRIKFVVGLPFRLALLPFVAAIGFFSTDWEREMERDSFRRAVRDLLK